MKKLLFLVIIVSITKSTILCAYPGYLSRDCIAFATKESITLDWKSSTNFFFTKSTYLTPGQNGNLKITICSTGVNCENTYYEVTWKSYAGASNLKNLTSQPLGVRGDHYWFRPNRYGYIEEHNISFATDCNAAEWGLENWND